MLLKRDWGQFFSQKQEDGWFHPVAYGSQALTMHEKNYHSTKLRVSGIEMGRYGTFQGISAVPNLLGKN